MSEALESAARALGRTPGALGFDADQRRAELATKLARVGAWLEARGADALHLGRAENLAWITGGGDFLVRRDGPPIAEAIATGDGLVVATNRIEAARLEAEELPPGARVEVVPWFEPGVRAARVRELIDARRVLADADVDLGELRNPLLPVERARLATVGEIASRALGDAASALDAGFSERVVAARLHGAIRAAGADLPVLLVAGESRLGHVRHPVPTDAPFGRVGLLVVAAQRFGLVASLSRLVAFESVPEPVATAFDKVLRVEASMLAATGPNVAAAAVLEAARHAYAEAGVPDAWRDHHQGGPAGYLPRDWLAVPGEGRELRSGMAVAWNPSLPWAKSEDTFLIEEDGVLTNLTWDPRWPFDEVAGRPRARVRVL
ncbi:MAG: M24 family metallopeptidase [Trueperaceae bacterium]